MPCVKPRNPYSEVSCRFGDDRGEWSKGGGFVLVLVTCECGLVFNCFSFSRFDVCVVD